jgi:hypothetical protein
VAFHVRDGGSVVAVRGVSMGDVVHGGSLERCGGGREEFVRESVFPAGIASV